VTLAELPLLLGERVTVKIRIRPVNGKQLCEVELHEDCDGFGVNAHAVHEDLEQAVRLAIQDLDDAVDDERAAAERRAS
jgi:predicted thioesterase